MYLGFLVSGIFLFLALRKINLTETIAAIELADYWKVIGASSGILFLSVLRALRWKYLIENHHLLPSWFFIRGFFIGFLANSALPARLGEIVRAKSLGDLSKTLIKTGGTKSLASIFIEKILDGLILLLIFIVLTLFFPITAWMKTIAWMAASIFIGLFTVILLTLFYEKHIKKLLRKLSCWLSEGKAERILQMFNWFTEGLGVIKNRRDMIRFVLASFLIWILEGFMIFLFIRSLNIDAPIISGYFVMIMVAFGIALPSAPGYLGIYQFMCMKALAIWGVNESVALSFSLVMQFATYIPMNLIGLGFLMSSKMSFNARLIPKTK